VMLFLSVWGWLKLESIRWRVFFVLVVFFDFSYTIFLNTITLKITAFNLPTCFVSAILMGVGIDRVIKSSQDFSGIGSGIKNVIKMAFCIIPSIPFLTNYDLCDQSRNYTAYEHAVNIFRTTEYGDTLFMNGDNYVFPVLYGRIAERMRQDITLYDRNNIFYKLMDIKESITPYSISWEDKRNNMEKRVIEKNRDRNIYYAVFGPYAISLPDQYRFIPYGVLYRVIGKGERANPKSIINLWKYYSTVSFDESFYRDFMNREVSAYFLFCRGKSQFLAGKSDSGLKLVKLSSEMGYDDNIIHSEIAIFFTEEGLFKEARLELEKALIYHEDLSSVYNNWGYYYHKIGDYGKATESFRKAIELKPDDFGYHNNLAFSLYERGKNEESLLSLKRSLAINDNQEEISEFIRIHFEKANNVK
ncbi:MAG: tetratricopeptide repeat protein, partial [Thermodesulfobacteriota bacterium]|nr:tetratricopeptide repeat protein [Thermodesulfobacteriota bacterium]